MLLPGSGTEDGGGPTGSRPRVCYQGYSRYTRRCWRGGPSSTRTVVRCRRSCSTHSRPGDRGPQSHSSCSYELTHLHACLTGRTPGRWSSRQHDHRRERTRTTPPRWSGSTRFHTGHFRTGGTRRGVLQGKSRVHGVVLGGVPHFLSWSRLYVWTTSPLIRRGVGFLRGRGGLRNYLSRILDLYLIFREYRP